MLQLKASDLLHKRQMLLEGEFQKDYDTAVQSITLGFEDPTVLLSNSPFISVRTSLKYTATVLKSELEQQGFIVTAGSDHTLTIALHVETTQEEQPKEEITPVVEQPVQVVVPTVYSHSDLQYNRNAF